MAACEILQSQRSREGFSKGNFGTILHCAEFGECGGDEAQGKSFGVRDILSIEFLMLCTAVYRKGNRQCYVLCLRLRGDWGLKLSLQELGLSCKGLLIVSASVVSQPGSQGCQGLSKCPDESRLECSDGL